MIDKLRAAVLAGLLLAGTAGALGAQPSGARLAVVNSQDILEKSVEGKKAYAELEGQNKKYQADLARLDDQIRQLQNRLDTQRLTLTDEAAAALQADLEKKQTERQRVAEDASQDMQNRQYNLLVRIQTELIPIIEQVRKEMGLDVIIDLAKEGAVYFNPAVDLTAEIVKRYDAAKAAPPAKKQAR